MLVFSLGVAKPQCSHGHILCTTCLRLKTWRQGVGKIDERTTLSSQAFLYTFSTNSGFCGQNQFVCTFGWAWSSLWIPKKATILRSFLTYCLFLLIHFLYASWQSLLASVLKLNCSQLLNYIGSSGAFLGYHVFLEAVLYDSSITNHPCSASPSKLLIT